jgi:hypothetical protein
MGTFGRPRKLVGSEELDREASADLCVTHLVARGASHQREHDGITPLFRLRIEDASGKLADLGLADLCHMGHPGIGVRLPG